jgi:23S rRNA (uracil1939-C5)-methyltransferase
MTEMQDLQQDLQIERLGQRGEGIAHADGKTIYVPYALAGETVRAEIDGERGQLVDILKPSPDRIEAVCPYYGTCGGCAVQTLDAPAYATWKRDLVATTLKHARVEAEVGALVDAHGDGRRRATFHARYGRRGEVDVGYMKSRAHEIVAIEMCPILAPSMAGALPAARAIAQVLKASGKPLDILVTATLTGLDIDVKGHGPLAPQLMEKLTSVAATQNLARLSNHGLLVIERRPPLLRMGRAEVTPPPGAFLQATEAGEIALADTVREATAGSRRILDLFAGVGTFSLRLAESAHVHAADTDAAALAALARAAKDTSDLRPVTTETRDLFRRPLAGTELDAYDAAIFDPPRAGAEAQAKALAASAVPLIVAVSCNPASFARDVGLLAAAGYELAQVTPFDQFRYSPHVEIIGILRKAAKSRRNRRLLA